MKLRSRSFADGGVIPGRCAFAVRAPKGHVRLSQNLNPHLAWTGAPTGTRSFALVCTDVDVPTRPDDVNQEGREVPPTLPRTQFAHWLMVDIPATTTMLAEGACSRGVVPRGKQAPAGPEGSRQGVNDYTLWFKGDKDMGGSWRGYDGPCPPWNDSLVHHYGFEVLALDVEHLKLKDDFMLADVHQALDGHVLARAMLVGRYSLNPRLTLKP